MRLSVAALVVLLFGFTLAKPDSEIVTFKPDKSHSKVGFKVRHLGIANVRGAFSDYDYTIAFDPEDLSTLTADVTINAASVDTENERRDNDLRSEGFFHVEKYPTVRFVSKGVRNIEGNTFELVGDLTIKDVTKEVVLETEYFGSTTQRGRRKAGFEAHTTINRFDFGLKWDALTEAGGLVVGENVEVILELEMGEQTAG